MLVLVLGKIDFISLSQPAQTAFGQVIIMSFESDMFAAKTADKVFPAPVPEKFPILLFCITRGGSAMRFFSLKTSLE